MAEPNWVRHSLRLGFSNVQRRLRAIRHNRSRLWLLGITFALFTFSFGGMAVLFALALRGYQTPITIPKIVRLFVTFPWLLLIWYTSQRVIFHHQRLRNESFVLTTVSIRTAVGSLLIADFVFACLMLTLPTILLVGVITYAFLQWESVVLIPISILLFAACTTVIGYLVGFVYLRLSARSSSVQYISTIAKILARIAILLSFIAVATTGIIPYIGVTVGSHFEWLPTSWLIDLAALGTPTTASVGRAVGITVCVAVIVVTGFLAIENLATTCWYSSSSAATKKEKSNTNDYTAISLHEDALTKALSPLFVPKIVNMPTRRVAQVVLLRLRRAPRRFWFLLGPALAFMVINMAETAHPMDRLPILCAVAIPWLTGAAFGLNPLGDAGAVLPTMLTSLSGQEFARGLALPSIIYGLPLTVICTLVASIFSSYTGVEIIGLVVLGGMVTVVTSVVAPAIGMRFPRFDAIIIGQRRGILPPSLTALTIYTIVISALGEVTTFIVLRSSALHNFGLFSEIPASLSRLSAIIGVSLVALLIVILAYKSVGSRFSTYVLN